MYPNAFPQEHRKRQLSSQGDDRGGFTRPVKRRRLSAGVGRGGRSNNHLSGEMIRKIRCPLLDHSNEYLPLNNNAPASPLVHNKSTYVMLIKLTGFCLPQSKFFHVFLVESNLLRQCA
jgi:hypothetical protein